MLSFGNSSTSDQSSNNASSRNPSKQGNMATNGKINSSEENADDNRDAVTKSKILGISSYSNRLEEILLALLQQQQRDRDKIDGLNKKIEDEKFEREDGMNKLSDRISTEVRDREEVNEAVTDALQELSKQIEDSA